MIRSEPKKICRWSSFSPIVKTTSDRFFLVRSFYKYKLSIPKYIETVKRTHPTMMEVLLTILNKTDILIVETLDHEFQTFNDDYMLLLMRLAQFITCVLILGSNLQIIIFIMNQASKTFLDRLVIFDCFLCLSNVPVVMLLSNYSDFIDSCIFHVFLSYFTNLCNRLLSLGIVIYRLILVLGSSLMFSSYQKKMIENSILLVILIASLKMTGWAIYYRENNRYFLSWLNT